MTEEQLNHRLQLRAYDLVNEAAQRGQELSYDIAWMRAVGQYNRDPKAWEKEWSKKGKKVRLF
jgi:16S rRNA G527 N7-methylase RsmG